VEEESRGHSIACQVNQNHPRTGIKHPESIGTRLVQEVVLGDR